MTGGFWQLSVRQEFTPRLIAIEIARVFAVAYDVCLLLLCALSKAREQTSIARSFMKYR